MASTQPTAAQTLAGFATGLRLEDIPPAVREKAKLHLLDTLGVMLAASNMEYAAMVHRVAAEMGGREEATVLAFGGRLPAAQAALVSGALAHGLDYDDTHTESVVHASSSVVATSLAMAERQGADGAEMLAASVLGYEVAIRVGAVAANGFNGRGFHATGVCGAFGAAAIAGKLLGLDAGRLASALGIVGSQASGTEQSIKDGTWAKRLHPGWAAHSGIIAALLAREGYLGPAAVLEGSWGFLHSHLDPAPFDTGRLVRGLGSEWVTLEMAIKLYPACHHLHGPLDAALGLCRREGIRSEEIEEVICHVPEAAVPVVCEPREVRLNPSSSYAARFSINYGLALGLVAGHALPPAFTEERIRDPRVRELAPRVRYVLDPDTIFPAAYGGAVDLVLKDGRRFHLRVPACKGSPQNPASAEEVQAKFFANVEGILSARTARQVAEMALSVESLPALGPLVGLLRVEGAPDRP